MYSSSKTVYENKRIQLSYAQGSTLCITARMRRRRRGSIPERPRGFADFSAPDGKGPISDHACNGGGSFRSALLSRLTRAGPGRGEGRGSHGHASRRRPPGADSRRVSVAQGTRKSPGSARERYQARPACTFSDISNATGSRRTARRASCTRRRDRRAPKRSSSHARGGEASVSLDRVT